MDLKFYSDRAKFLYELAESGNDVEALDIEGLGWYALFASRHSILWVDKWGNVNVKNFKSRTQAWNAWEDLVQVSAEQKARKSAI